MQYSESRQGMVPTESAKSLVPNQQVTQKLQPLLTQMVKYLMKKKPEDPVPHMVQFLSDQAGQGHPELTMEERIELENLRKIHQSLKEKLDEQGK